MELSELNQALGQITQTASENSAWSAEQARIQREWQEQQNAKAMKFNASEAAKNRDWQQMMSNTAHQREIVDLKAAGLNPVLSAMNGNGASVTSGATASGVTSQGAKGERDTSANAAIVGLLGSFLSAQTQLEAANINARTQEAVADKYAAVDALAARLTNEAAHYGVDNPNTIAGIVRSALTGDYGVKGTVKGVTSGKAVESAKGVLGNLWDAANRTMYNLWNKANVNEQARQQKAAQTKAQADSRRARSAARK